MEVRKLSDNSLVYSSVTADDGSVTETAFGKTYTRKTNDDSYTQSTGQTVKSGTVTSPGTATALSEKTDYFGRTLEKSVLAKNGTAVTGGVSTSYEYKSASAAQTSDRVNILRNAIKTGANTSATKDFSYTYDGNGNIKTVHQVNNDGGSTLLYTYHYDAANQLTRVDDKVQDLTVVYVYNEGGNLVSRTNYKYTTGTPLLLKRTCCIPMTAHGRISSRITTQSEFSMILLATRRATMAGRSPGRPGGSLLDEQKRDGYRISIQRGRPAHEKDGHAKRRVNRV